MKTQQAIDTFGSIAKLARALGISTAAIYQWGEDVPPLRAYQIREIADREKADQAQHKEAA